ncbi:PREDICTED: protein FAM166A [Pterocles gutturalis]|nr:PREDICTED: protein FAM166A [Pterocles gutturalis]
MAAPRKSSLFPPQPYHIPGYDGFIPQYNFQFGDTFGRTTYRLLTDPSVQRSPCPLLAPLHKPKFVEDFSGMKHGVQGHLPGRPGYFPYEKPGAASSFTEPVLETKLPPVVPGPAEEELMVMNTDTVPQHRPDEHILTTQLPRRYPWRMSHRPASEEQEWRLPEIAPRSAWPGSKPPVQSEGVTLPGVAETADVEQDNWLPRLDVPNAIQQKVVSGYAGFIPRLTWVTGVNYVQSVKEAMNEFDRQQFLERNPSHSFGRRFPQTYWPNNRIYTSAGLIPFYAGFVPNLRHTYALTFGNSTRKAYEKEEKRRASAL